MRHKDYYRILDVDEDATAAEIKKAFRRLARKFHPDVSVIKDAEERFKEVAEAYEILKDPDKRSAYDCFGCDSAEGYGEAPDWERQFREFFARADDACDLDDLFAMLRCGSGRATDPEFAAFGHDIEITAQITLEEAARGTVLKLELSEPSDGGSGRGTRIVQAHVPRGVRHGQKFTVPGEAVHPDGAASSRDLHIRIALKPHPVFRVKAYDLTLELPVAPWEAALGATLEVPTLEGRVKLRIPPGTQSNDKLRLAGRGLPKPDGSAGDLYARARIVTPSVLSEREKQLSAELARASSFEPRAHLV